MLQFMKETFKTGKQCSQQKLPHMDKAGVECKAQEMHYDMGP